ncbi:MAG: hypothetical protein SO068_01490 [Sodaliphilus sp.]|nr:hypothetical protein [Sodaliphilus sp.]
MHLETCNPSRAHPFYLGLLAPICVITSWQLLGAVLSPAFIQRVSGLAYVGVGTRRACLLSPEFPHCVPSLSALVVGGAAS